MGSSMAVEEVTGNTSVQVRAVGAAELGLPTQPPEPHLPEEIYGAARLPIGLEGTLEQIPDTAPDPILLWPSSQPVCDGRHNQLRD